MRARARLDLRGRVLGRLDRGEVWGAISGELAGIEGSSPLAACRANGAARNPDPGSDQTREDLGLKKNQWSLPSGGSEPP